MLCANISGTRAAYVFAIVSLFAFTFFILALIFLDDRSPGTKFFSRYFNSWCG